MVTPAASKAKQEAAKKEAKKEVKKEVAKVIKVSKPKKVKVAKKAKGKAVSTAKQVVTSVAAPAAIGRKERNYFTVKPLPGARTGVRIRGCEFLDTVTTTASQAVGDVLFNGPINPLAFVGTRLAVMASTFEKYRFNRFRIIAVPFVGTNVAGGYGLAYDRDPSDLTPTGGLTAIRAFNAMPGTVNVSCWEAAELDCPIMDPTTDFFTNSVAASDERLVDQGQIYMFCTTAIATVINYNLLIEYDLSMWIPELGATLSSVKFAANNLTNTLGWSTNNAYKSISGLISGWAGILPQLGDTSRLPMGYAVDNTSYGLKLPGGLWTIANILQATAGTWYGGFGFSTPGFVANDSREQNDFAINALNVFSAAAGSGVTQAISGIYDVLVPPNGGTLLCTVAGTLPITLTGTTVFNVLANPSRTSPSLSLAVSLSGKWKRALLEKNVRDAEAEKEREKLREVAPAIQLVGAPQGSSVVTGQTGGVPVNNGFPQQQSYQNISSPSMPTFRQ